MARRTRWRVEETTTLYGVLAANPACVNSVGVPPFPFM